MLNIWILSTEYRLSTDSDIREPVIVGGPEGHRAHRHPNPRLRPRAET